jgi:uracil phosphoribosyltransferase
MKVINLGESNSILNRYVAELREKEIQKESLRFRRNLERIGEVFAYEISKTLQYSPKTILTPLSECTVSTCDDRIVIGTVLRAGLALHEGFMQIFDEADAGFVAAYRKEDGNEIAIQLDYLACPSLDGCTFLLVDPMLATGKSFETAYNAYLNNGKPACLHIVAVVASEQGVAYLKDCFPSDDVTLWCAVIDPELNSLSYIVPGLGDCGDLCFGEKL